MGALNIHIKPLYFGERGGAPMSDKLSEVHREEVQKFILIRRKEDKHNEVLALGRKSPSAIGVVDFHQYVTSHGLLAEELAQFLKVPIVDIRNLYIHGGWICPDSRKNLDLLLKLFPDSAIRHNFCRFLMIQEGSAGLMNVYIPPEKSLP